MNTCRPGLAFVLVTLLFVSACVLRRSVPNAGDSQTGSDATLANSDISGSWRSVCVVSNQVAGGGAGSYLVTVTFYGTDSFNYNRLWYLGTECDPNSGAALNERNSGSYAVHQNEAGSIFTIGFLTAGSYLEPQTAQMASWLSSTGCSGGPSFANGLEVAVFGVSCPYAYQPAQNEVLNNVIRKTSSTTFLLGELPTISTGPGRTAAQSSATQPTLLFNSL